MFSHYCNFVARPVARGRRNFSPPPPSSCLARLRLPSNGASEIRAFHCCNREPQSPQCTFSLYANAAVSSLSQRGRTLLCSRRNLPAETGSSISNQTGPREFDGGGNSERRICLSQLQWPQFLVAAETDNRKGEACSTYLPVDPEVLRLREACTSEMTSRPSRMMI